MTPHLSLLNDRLFDVAAGRIRRLLITMPPRHGKSLFASCHFPAWLLCRRPWERIILASYGASFASQWGRKVRDVIGEMGPLFGVAVRTDMKAADQWETTAGGGMQTCGVGGSLTGKGANLLIIDDPVKNAEEANSTTYREKTWDWYTSTAYTRLEPVGAVVLIQTRWHGDDLAGRVLERAKETGEDWCVVNLPALAEEGDALKRRPGEPLWSERFDASDLDRIRRTIGSYQFSALYQQRPQPAAGGLFKRQWFRYWKHLDGDVSAADLGGGRIISIDGLLKFATADLAFSTKTGADYTAIGAWGLSTAGELILLDVVRAQMPGPALVPTMQQLVRKHDLDYIGIEDVAAQLGIVQAAREAGLTVRQLRADRDKVTRAVPAMVRMEAGQVYFPRSHAHLGDLESELLSFPRAAHDDLVDMTSYAAAEAQRLRRAGEPETLEPIPPAIDDDDDRWWR